MSRAEGIESGAKLDSFAPSRESLARSPLLRQSHARTTTTRTTRHNKNLDNNNLFDDDYDDNNENDDIDVAYLAAADASSDAPFAQVEASSQVHGALQLHSHPAPRDWRLTDVIFPRDLERDAATDREMLAYVAALDRALLRWRLAAALFWFTLSLTLLAPMSWSLFALVLGASSGATIAVSLPTVVWWALQCLTVVSLAVARSFAADISYRDRAMAAAWRFAYRLAALVTTLLGGAACALAVKSMRIFAANGTNHASRASLWPIAPCLVTQPELGQCVDADGVADWLASLTLAWVSTWIHMRSTEFRDVYPSVDRRRLDRFRARLVAIVAGSVLETLAVALVVYLVFDGSGALEWLTAQATGMMVRPRPHAAGLVGAVAAAVARVAGFALGGGISCFAWHAMRTVLAIVSTEIVDVDVLAPEAMPSSFRPSRGGLVDSPNVLALRLHESSPAVRLVAAAALSRVAVRAPLRRRFWSDAEGRVFEPALRAWTTEIRRCAWLLHCAMSRGSGRVHDVALWPDMPPPQLITGSFADVRAHYTARRRRRQILYDRILDEMPPVSMVGHRFRAWLRTYWFRDQLCGTALTRSALPDDGQLVLLCVRSLAAVLAAAAGGEDQNGVCQRLKAPQRAVAALDQLISALDLYCLSGLAHGESGDALQSVSEEALQLAPPVAAAMPSNSSSQSSQASSQTPGRVAVRVAARQPRRAAASSVRQLPGTPYALSLVAKHARRCIAKSHGLSEATTLTTSSLVSAPVVSSFSQR